MGVQTGALGSGVRIGVRARPPESTTSRTLLTSAAPSRISSISVLLPQFRVEIWLLLLCVLRGVCVSVLLIVVVES